MSLSDTPDFMSWFQLNSSVTNFQQQYVLEVSVNWLPSDIRDYTVRVYGNANLTIAPMNQSQVVSFNNSANQAIFAGGLATIQSPSSTAIGSTGVNIVLGIAPVNNYAYVGVNYTNSTGTTVSFNLFLLGVSSSTIIYSTGTPPCAPLNVTGVTGVWQCPVSVNSTARV